MSDVWIAVAVGVLVPVVVLLGPYAWMLIPRHWERQVPPEERARITQQYVDDFQAGLELGLRRSAEDDEPVRLRPNRLRQPKP